MKDKLQTYRQGFTDYWDKPQRLVSIQRCLEKIDLEGKTILETGSRYGLISYMAMLAGAKHVTGVEINYKLSELSKKLFKDAGMEGSFLSQDIFDHIGSYDLVLYLGVFYNTPNSEALLRQFHHCPQILVESHLPTQNIDHPMSVWETRLKVVEENNLLLQSCGRVAGETIEFRQYFSNHKWLQKVFKRSGFSYNLLEQSGGNCFYLLTPNNPIEYCNNRWGTSSKECKYI